MNTISKGLSLCVILVVAWGIQKAMTTPPVGMNTNDYLEFGDLISEAGRASVALTFYQKAALLDETNLVARVKLLYLEGDMLRESGRPTEAMLKYKAAAVIQNADAKSRSSRFIVRSLIIISATIEKEKKTNPRRITLQYCKEYGMTSFEAPKKASILSINI